jgi:O-antigen ligase
MAIGLWMLVSVLAAIFSQWPQRGLVRQAEWFGWMAACIVMVVASRQWAWWNISVFILALLGWGYVTAESLLLVLEHGALSNEPWDNQAWTQGVIPGCRNVRHFGYACAFATMTLAVLPLLGGSRWWFRHGAWLVWGIAWATVFWGGGRGPFVACVISSLLLLILVPRAQRWNYSWSLVFAFFVGIFFALIFPAGDSLSTFGPLRILFPATEVVSAGADAISSGRLSIWQALLGHWAENPWLGVGPDTVIVTFNGGIIQPHSVFVQVLLDWGVIGAATALLCLALILRNRLAFYRDNHKPMGTENLSAQWSFFITWLSAMVGLSFFSLVDGIFYYAWPMWLICSITGWAFPASIKVMGKQPLICQKREAIPSLGFALIAAFVLAMATFHLLSGKALQSASPTTLSEIPKITRWFPSYDNEDQRCAWIRSVAKNNLADGIAFARECAHRCSQPWQYLVVAAKCAGEQGETELEQKLLIEAKRR